MQAKFPVLNKSRGGNPRGNDRGDKAARAMGAKTLAKVKDQ